MLTKNDLDQIRGIFTTEVREIVRNEVREVVREEVKAEVSMQLKPVNRKLNRIQKDMKLMALDYTNIIKHVIKRVDRIEKHVGLS